MVARVSRRTQIHLLQRVSAGTVSLVFVAHLLPKMIRVLVLLVKDVVFVRYPQQMLPMYVFVKPILSAINVNEVGTRSR